MDEKRIYKFSLLLPIILPILSLCLIFLKVDWLPVWFSSLLWLTAASGVIGGVPYVIIALFLFVWMDDIEPKRVWNALRISPLIMIPVSLLLLVVYLIGSSNESETTSIWDTFWAIGPIMAGFILVFGYFYVFLTFALVKLFAKKTIDNIPD